MRRGLGEDDGCVGIADFLLPPLLVDVPVDFEQALAVTPERSTGVPSNGAVAISSHGEGRDDDWIWVATFRASRQEPKYFTLIT